MNGQRLPSTLWHALLANLRCDAKRASNFALLSPQQGIRWTYHDMVTKARGLSKGLQDRGVARNHVVATDLPNVAEGLLLHLACARLGASIATAKSSDGLKSMPKVQCAVVANTKDWLSNETFEAPHIVAGEAEMDSMIAIDMAEDSALDEDTDVNAVDGPLGYFGSSNALTHGSALQQGLDMKNHLEMSDTDKACVSITLYHAFGIGSACSSALLSGAAIVLPAVGGLQGCGVPSQRAAVTLETLSSEKCTLLFADTHTLKALHSESLATALQGANLSEHLRGGVCKTGSGTDILDETVELAGVTLATLGKKG